MPDSKKIDYIQERVDSIATTMASIDKEVALQKASFDSHSQQDEGMYSELKRMNDILQQNTESLKEHMGNNLLLKEMIVSMNKRLEPLEIEFIEKIAVRNWVMSKAKFIGKVGGAVGAIAGVWMYVKPFLERLFTSV